MLMNVQIENKKGNKTLTLENVVYIQLLDDGNYLIEYTNDNSRTNDYILDTTRYTIKNVWNSPFRKTDVLEAKWWTISKVGLIKKPQPVKKRLKVGDRVIHHTYGYGVVVLSSVPGTSGVLVKFDIEGLFHHDGKKFGYKKEGCKNRCWLCEEEFLIYEDI